MKQRYISVYHSGIIPLSMSSCITHIYSVTSGSTATNSWSWSDAYIDGLVQDCSNSNANALELLQSCTKSLIWLSVNQVITGSDNFLLPVCYQSNIWTNAGLLLIGPGFSTRRVYHGLVQERRNSSVLAMELRLSCTNTSIYKGNHAQCFLFNSLRPSDAYIRR